MAYLFYLGDTLLPVTPSKLQLKISNNNKTVTLINEGEINILKDAGLTEINFEVLLPNVKYPFDNSIQTNQPASYYLEVLEKLKTSKKPFQFIVTRTRPNGEYLFDTNIKTSLEDYTITEDAEKYGIDVSVAIKLKQYKEYCTKKLITTSSSSSQSTKATVETTRPSDKIISKTHTVKSGETLWFICKKELGDGSKYAEIAKLNGISNPNVLKVGQVIKLG